MTIGWLSSLALSDTPRSSIARTQARIQETSVEASTGRHYDVGRALGSATRRSIEMRNAIGDIDAVRMTNELASGRLSAVQSALTAMTELANGFFESVVGTAHSGADRPLLVEDARGRLATLTSLLSTTSNGAYVFGGANATVRPIEDYQAQPPPPARAAVVATFEAQFGFPPGDARAAAITPEQMQSYLDGAFASLFRDPSWQATFSAASGDTVSLRISPREVAQSSLSANDSGVRRLVSALIATLDMGIEKLNAATFEVVATSLARGASEAAGELTRSQAEAGVLQDRLAKAGERMQIERGLLERSLGDLESVDQLEATARLNDLTRQLEVSYAITARLQKLSLLEYL